MKKNKGFTLVELLAVIVVLGILMTVASMAIIKNINDSKAKIKSMAAKDIMSISESYFIDHNMYPKENGNCSSSAERDGSYHCDVTVETLINEGYIEQDATNPATGDNNFIGYARCSKVRFWSNDYGHTNTTLNTCTVPKTDCYFSTNFVYAVMKDGPEGCVEICEGEVCKKTK